MSHALDLHYHVKGSGLAPSWGASTGTPYASALAANYDG